MIWGQDLAGITPVLAQVIVPYPYNIMSIGRDTIIEPYYGDMGLVTAFWLL